MNDQTNRTAQQKPNKKHTTQPNAHRVGRTKFEIWLDTELVKAIKHKAIDCDLAPGQVVAKAVEQFLTAA